MNKPSHEQRCAVLKCLVDGCSIRATTRITGVSKNAIQRLTIAVGEACLNYSDKALRRIKSRRVQVDEVWCFCYAKDKNLPEEMRGEPGVGSLWTWTALDADTKLMISWRLGGRDAANANMFIGDFADRLANKVQLTSDGNAVYFDAVQDHFVYAVDYAQLVKMYGAEQKDESRYSPAKCLGTKRKKLIGEPDEDHISTSYVERQNLNIRMQNRRYTRLTNAFSKKAEMLAYSIAITFTYHNFVRPHMSLSEKGELPRTPAMVAGVASRQWTIADL
jgi:IS1 family transposase